MNIGKNIKEIRDERGLTQEKLAYLSNLTKQSIYLIENNINKNIGIDTLNKIANALDVSIEKLLK